MNIKNSILNENLNEKYKSSENNDSLLFYNVFVSKESRKFLSNPFFLWSFFGLYFFTIFCIFFSCVMFYLYFSNEEVDLYFFALFVVIKTLCLINLHYFYYLRIQD